MRNITTYLLACGCLMSTALFAQNPAKVEKKEITIEKKEGSKKEKMVIVIDGDKVTINGLPSENYKGKQRIIIDEDIVINGNVVRVPGERARTYARTASNRALLGVTTEKTETGVKINSVSRESGAEKAGLKEGDILTEINTTAIKSPEQLSEVITQKKPGEVIDVTFLRDGKKQKVKATLGKSSESFTWNSDDFDFNFDGPMTFTVPRVPRFNEDQLKGLMMFSSDRPKYGMSIQDDEDARGVMVTEVEDESNASKGGLKKDDIITEIDGEKIVGVDDMREKLNDKKDQPSISVKVLRNGKTESLTVKVPRKIKSANL